MVLESVLLPIVEFKRNDLKPWIERGSKGESAKDPVGAVIVDRPDT